jgi:hypothetical protein
MTSTRWLVVIGSALNLGVAIYAAAHGLWLQFGVLLGLSAAWVGWAFWKDRG